MSKKYFLHIVAVGFIFGLAGCTSKKVDQESNSEIAEITGEVDDASGEGEASASEAKAEGDEFGGDTFEESTDVAQKDATEGGEVQASEELDGLDDLGSEEAAKTDSSGGTDDLAANTDAGGDGGAGSSELDQLETSDSAPVPEEPTMADNSASMDDTQGLSDIPMEEPKPVIPLQKMASAPYMSGGKWINAIYIARPGDTLKSVSQKIYGEDRSKELKKTNPTFARRGMKVGDKVYYNSPQRSTDSTTVLTYYEDMGLTPEVYMSQPGDNIRTVSKNLLGHENSWKEIWATNPDVESKGELPEGTRLRYWSTSVATPALAEAPPQEPSSAPVGTVGETDQSTMNDVPPPPPMEEPAQMPEEASVPPPPPIETAPPPEPAAIVPPPPPPVANNTPPPKPVKTGAGAIPGMSDDPDQMMLLGLGAILLLAAIFMFIIIKKKRARRNSGIDFQTATHTQIE